MAKLLVVEDDRNLATLYQDELTGDGYEVVLAADGEEALAKAERERPDLIVLDINIPKPSGLEAMGELLSRDSEIPIVLNTAYAKYKDNFMAWAADAYIVKSSDLTELKSKIAEILAARRE